VPDVRERRAAEVAAPEESQEHATEDGEDLVAAVLAAVIAAVRQLPHAVDGVGAVRLTEHLFKLSPHVVVQVIGISVAQIWWSHLGGLCCSNPDCGKNYTLITPTS